MTEAMEKISACFDRLQQLQILTTKGNMEKILQTLYDLQEVYKMLEEGGCADGREETDLG